MLFRRTRSRSTRVPLCLTWSRSVVLVCALFACSSAIAAPPIVHGDNNPYDQDWLVVWWTLRTKCSRCHRPGTERHDFTSYRAVIGGGLDGASHVVIPGDPDGSLLWENVVWNHAGLADSPDPEKPMMPPDRSEWLSAGQLTVSPGSLPE